MVFDSFNYPKTIARRRAMVTLAIIVVAHLLLFASIEQGFKSGPAGLMRSVVPVQWLTEPGAAKPVLIAKAEPPASQPKAPAPPSTKNTIQPKSSVDKLPTSSATNEPSTQESSQTDVDPKQTPVAVDSNSSVPVVVSPESKQLTVAVDTRSDSDITPASDQVVTAAARLAKLPPLIAPAMPVEAIFLVYQGDSTSGSILGKTILRLRPRNGAKNSADNAGYESEFVVNFNWLTRMLADDRTWRSSGAVTAAGLVPEQIIEIRGKRPPRQTDLDWPQLKATSGDVSFALVAGAQDRVSAIWQLGSMARSYPEQFTQNAQVELPLVASSKLTVSRWQVRQELLAAQGSSVRTLHLTRTDTRDDDLRFEFWLDSQNAMQPVKIRLTDARGRVFELIKEGNT
jgi:hypothetical protein